MIRAPHVRKIQSGLIAIGAIALLILFVLPALAVEELLPPGNAIPDPVAIPSVEPISPYDVVPYEDDPAVILRESSFREQKSSEQSILDQSEPTGPLVDGLPIEGTISPDSEVVLHGYPYGQAPVYNDTPDVPPASSYGNPSTYGEPSNYGETESYRAGRESIESPQYMETFEGSSYVSSPPMGYDSGYHAHGSPYRSAAPLSGYRGAYSEPHEYYGHNEHYEPYSFTSLFGPRAPAACCEPPKIKYWNHPLLAHAYCGCECKETYTTRLSVPCQCCPVTVKVCIPRCCVGAPSCETHRDLLGRKTYVYCWPCGYSVKIVDRHTGTLVVHTFNR